MRRKTSILTLLVFLLVLAGCSKDPEQQTDAELGLNAQQAQGRRIYRVYCAVCHSAYSSKALKGPSMMGVFKKQYLPSGMIASDRFAHDVIVNGRKMMPEMASSLTSQQVEDVIAYLHTL